MRIAKVLIREKWVVGRIKTVLCPPITYKIVLGHPSLIGPCCCLAQPETPAVAYFVAFHRLIGIQLSTRQVQQLAPGWLFGVVHISIMNNTLMTEPSCGYMMWHAQEGHDCPKLALNQLGLFTMFDLKLSQSPLRICKQIKSSLQEV